MPVDRVTALRGPAPRPGVRRVTAAAAGLLSIVLAIGISPAGAQSPELRWGGDAEGGAPFVEADPSDPTRVVGFDVDVARLIADGLGRRPLFVQSGFTTLDAAAARGDFEIALGGIEDTPARRARLAVTVPYYQFREVLTVRVEDGVRFRTLADLAGRRVATLGATLAFDLLTAAQLRHGVVPVPYEDDVHPYSDLALGRVDAVLLDAVLADRGVRRNPGLQNQDSAAGVGYYVGIFAPGNAGLRDRVDSILREAMRDGRLEAIFRRWGLWNPEQAELYARVLASAGTNGSSGPAGQAGSVDGAGRPAEGTAIRTSNWDAAVRYFPSLLRAAAITLGLSCVAMALAVAIGAVIASGRVYGPPAVRVAFTAWVELLRGTPLLLQLFVLYFGLAPLVQLPALVAALIGLGLNYGAYESEIYRGALLAVPAGQLDAARALGLTDRQTLWLVRGPQALRLSLAPMTNDFVALLKDSSLVSVITVVELTKQTSIFAANVGSWVVPGALCAALYLAMSLPLAAVARRLERRWGVR